MNNRWRMIAHMLEPLMLKEQFEYNHWEWVHDVADSGMLASDGLSEKSVVTKSDKALFSLSDNYELLQRVCPPCRHKKLQWSESIADDLGEFRIGEDGGTK